MPSSSPPTTRSPNQPVPTEQQGLQFGLQLTIVRRSPGRDQSKTLALLEPIRTTATRAANAVRVRPLFRGPVVSDTRPIEGSDRDTRGPLRNQHTHGDLRERRWGATPVARRQRDPRRPPDAVPSASRCRRPVAYLSRWDVVLRPPRCNQAPIGEAQHHPRRPVRVDRSCH
jgi:hypothetical protein